MGSRFPVSLMMICIQLNVLGIEGGAGTVP